MKKIFLAIYLLLIFSTTTANAYTVYVGIDTIDLTSAVGFYFEADVTSDQLDLTIYYQGDTVGVCGKDIGGAVPPNIFPPIPYPWYIGPLATSPTNAYIGIDMPAVFSWGNNSIHPLESGIILSLTADDRFSLNNFFLAGVNPEGELYFYDLNIIRISLDCIEGGGEGYIYSAVPIPGSLVLLGSGLIGLIGLGRRRTRK